MIKIPDLIEKTKKDAFDILDELNINYNNKTKKKITLKAKHGTIIETNPKKDEILSDTEVLELVEARNIIIFLPILLVVFLMGLFGTCDKADIFHIFHPRSKAPVIVGGTTDWENKTLVRVEKDAKNGADIDYYEYCVTDTDIKDCTWQKTKTKNAIISNTGKHKVVFRAVFKDGKISKNSNVVDVLIDNDNPIVEKVVVNSRTENSIKLSVTVEDKDSGVDKYYYSLDGKNYEEGKRDYTFKDLTPDTEYTIYLKVVDKVGNQIINSFTIKTNKVGETDVKGETHETAKIDDNKDDNKNDNQGKEDDNNKPTDNNKPDDNNNNNNGGNEGNNNQGGENNPGGNENQGGNNQGGNDPGNDPSGNEPETNWDIPIISLSLLPAEIDYKDDYDLPSSYSFGNDTGVYSCTIDGQEYTTTKNLLPGNYTVNCAIVSAHNKSASVSKDITVKLTEGDDLVLDGWLRLNLYYPENSTNWEWRLDKEDGIRTGYDNDSWQPYTGPILVKIEDISKIYIRYDLNGETKIIPPSGKVLVDIVPDSYSVEENGQTRVVINYDTNATDKKYRLNGGEWLDYTGPFVAGANTVIEAKATKNEDVYNSNGDYEYTQTSTGNDSVYISVLDIPVLTPGGGSSTPVQPSGGLTPSGPGGLPQGSGGSPVRPSSYLAGPTITSNPSDTIVEKTEVTITTEYPAQVIYYSVNYGKYQEYQYPFDVDSNSTIKAYYIRQSDGKKSSTSYYYVDNIKQHNLPYVKIKATPSNYLSEDVDKVDVTITCSDCDTLEYSYDGVIYETYISPLEITQSKTIYAKSRNQYGETVEDLVIRTKTPAAIKDELTVAISATPSKAEVTGLVGQTKISIMYDEGLTKKYYKLGYYGTWQEYTGPFTLSSNETVYAYGTGDNSYGEDELLIDYLTTGIASPKIEVSPTSPTSEVIVQIEYDKNASVKQYRIGLSGEAKDYTGPFYVNENTTIYAYNENILGNTASSTRKIKNIETAPNYTVLDKGTYYIIKLNYPDVSDVSSREYKWKTNGTWKSYDPQGILIIKPNSGITISSSGVKVEDENGNDVIFTDHYYMLDVPLSELSENLFMRWDNEKPAAPTILVNPSDEPTKEVDVYITYPLTVINKYYKVVKEDGTDSGWLEYEGQFKVDSNNTTIYAKGSNRLEIESKVASLKISNIDAIAPTIVIKGDYNTKPKQKDSLNVKATDDLEVDVVKYAKGELPATYFKTAGTLINNGTSVEIKENGVYTFYAKDKVGNETVEVIEVTNIDNTAPEVVITDLTEEFGPTATIEIEYGDSTIKLYSIGNNTNYVAYTDTITINALDYYQYVNEDGSLTIYAKGIDTAANETEVTEKIYSIDLDVPATPVITSLIDYPVLTKDGIKLEDGLMVTYDSRNDTKNYIDAGLGYVEYKGAVNINKGTVKAKSVKTSTGTESAVATKEIKLPDDALKVEAYDKKADTETTIPANSTVQFKVANDGKTKLIKIKSNAITANSTLKLYGLDGTVTKEVELNDNNQSVKISSSITKVEIVTSTNALSISEIEMEKIVETIEGNSILEIMQKYPNLEEGYYIFKVGEENYSIHLYVLNGDQVIANDQQYGDHGDVGTKSSYAENMVIVRVNGDYTVNEGVTVSPYYTEYGGPKGFMLYVTGKLTNNGTINNSHGAYAVGQDIYLWKNSKTNDYEYVPEIGGAGGIAASKSAGAQGGSGESVSKRALAGGGAGGGGYGTNGSGTAATSYSGGTGGAYYLGKEAKPYGGQGGSGATNNNSYYPGGGAGNPGGIGRSGYYGENGTGGLLVIYSNEFINNGNIKADGSRGNGYDGAINGNSSGAGGSSGGGSINIFTNQPTNINSLGTVVDVKYNSMLGNTKAPGGISLGEGQYHYNGGKGGAGTVNIGEIIDGQYYDLKEIIRQDMDAYAESITITGESILDILNNNPNLEPGYHNFRVVTATETVIYGVHLYVLDGDQVIDTDTQYGDAADCATGATEDKMAKNMVIVRVNGNYTVNSDVTVEPYYDATYGGPKGFMLYVTGNLTNNGTINNIHGAYAYGENVYLWKNSITNDYEVIPAIGGAGGVAASKKAGAQGGSGESVSKRALAGGGAGGGGYGSNGSGTAATSYSGGTGGAYYLGTEAKPYGGQGGSGATNNNSYYPGGGAGNPGGIGRSGYYGENGTGGLLIIYSNEFINNGNIKADGSRGNGYSGTIGGNSSGSGGSSGGGSINIFTNQSTNINSLGTVVDVKYSSMLGNTKAPGGVSLGEGQYHYNGGKGGAGTVNIGEIREGQYYDLKNIITQDMDAYAESITKTGESILDIMNKYPNLEPGYHNFRVVTATETVIYGVHLYVLDGDQVIDTDTQYGDAADCATGATEDKMAKNMVIVRVNGDLVNNAVMSPYYDATYGGPKGFMVYVTGNLINNGVIDNSHGAYAYGENVYLWKNSITNDYEVIPAIGGAGGVAASKKAGAQGYNGNNVSKRALGGGGAGGGQYGSNGSGTAATSYSGGTGGAYYKATEAQEYGGQGGSGSTSNNSYYPGGGAGNPGGIGRSGYYGENGTGGLLIIYSNGFENNGSLKTEGSKGNGYNGTIGGNSSGSGGSSGGGSINIFTNQQVSGITFGININDKYNEILGSTNVLGGVSLGEGRYHYNGGKGGTGTVNIGGIREGQYYDLTSTIEQDYELFLDDHKVVLTLETGDGYLAETEMYVKPYKKITSINLPTPSTNESTIFVGWYYDDTLTSPVSSNLDYEIRDPFTLYAKYKYILPLNTSGLSLDYSGEENIVKVQKTGKYKIEVWGASGGRALCNNSLCGTAAPGGYASGVIDLTENDMLYINVGGLGQNGIYKANTPGGYNGGGSATWDNSDDESAGSGGGATDIRYMNNSLAARIMVAGGGGGSSYGKVSGYGGGLTGGDGNGSNAPGATQTTGFSFGIGKNGEGTGSSDGVAGGGGGYYGGTSYNASNGESASGGSGYISGHTGCVAIKSADDISPKDGCTNGTTDPECSIHYSEKVFEETVLTAGNASMPTYDGTGTMVGNTGNGYVKITYIEDTNDDTDHDTVFGIFNNPRKLIHDPLFYVALIAIVFSIIVLLSLNIVNEANKYKYAAIVICAVGVVELVYKLFF